ncbi:MAG TPA: MFS transporter [Burkholderiales bacterium]|nr:MFS transporter [Burkholderiales bacterium]
MTSQNADAPAAGSMTFWNRDFLFGISGFFFLYMAVSLFYYLPVFLRPFAARQSQIGLIMGLFSVVAIAVRPLFGRMIDLHGGRPLAVVGIAVLAAGVPFFHLVHDAGWLPLVLRGVMGAGWGVSMSATIALCSDLAPADRLARSMGIIGVAGLVANALGPLAAEEISRRYGFGMVFDASLICLGLALAGVLAARGVARPKAGGPPAGFRSLGRVSLITVVIVAAMPVFHGAIRGVIIYFIAVFGKSVGLERVGSFFLVFSLAAILTRFGTGDFSDRFGRKTVILPAALIIVANLFLISRLRTTPLLVGTAFLGGIGQGLIYPALSTYIIDFMGRTNKGLAISMYNSLFDVGMGVGSPFFGWIADLMGYRRMYVFAGFFLLTATAVFMARAPVTEKQTLGEVPYVSG